MPESVQQASLFQRPLRLLRIILDSSARDHRMKGLSPPKKVLLEFCRQAPGLRVNDEAVRAEPRLNSKDVLTQTERDIVRILSEHCGAITPSELTSVCVGMGVNRQTFYHTLVNSPIFARYAARRYGRYGLIGAGNCSSR
jgi:hypothetical protein